MCALFGELGRRMGFEEACFDDREDELIDQALKTDDPVVCGDHAGAAGARGACAAAAAGECGGRGAAVQYGGVVQDAERPGRAGAGAGVYGSGGVAGACERRGSIRWSFCRGRRTTI